MSATLFGLTAYAEVIASMGLTSKELKEQEFNDSGIEQELELDLLRWFPEFKALSGESDSNDVDIKSQYLALKLYTKFFCTASLARSPLRFLQKKGDGNNTGERFTHARFLADLIEGAEAKMAEYKNAVLSYDTVHSPSTTESYTLPPGISIGSPGTDKITGQ